MKRLFLLLSLACVTPLFAASKLPSGWTVVYGSLDGCEGRAVELLTSELGDLLLRQPGVYATHVLPCRPAAECASVTGNVFLVGTLASNSALADYVRAADVPAGGYLVKTKNDEGRRGVVILAGSTPAAVIWAVADFVSDGLSALVRPRGDGLRKYRDVFDSGLSLLRYVRATAPESKVRSLFTWGHPIDDYRDYFRNMAKLRLNRVYLWNDYPPLNAREVVDCAHSWGIEVFWGFPWGWDTDCRESAKAGFDAIRERTLADWRKNWRDLPGDGIYFQTFTETGAHDVGGETMAARAVRLSNAIAETMFREKPAQRIVFGLHAGGVKDDLAAVAKADPRLEILWENTGAFPYHICNRTGVEEDAAFTRQVLSDKVHPVGVAWKCQLVQDWGNWTHQEGPYLLGVCSRRVYDADREIHDALWREFTGLWHEKASVAYEAAKLAHAIGPDVEMNGAVQCNGPIRFPTAFMAELFWSTEEPLETIRRRVLDRTRL